ncbi:TATA element modulatory factor [Fusarium oxysporum f. sp. albedinis]|nr:TATA element modulatory factor [Fusarium oxysporum f. sp. albedinis]
MFEAKYYLRFDLENPWQAVIIPTKYHTPSIFSILLYLIRSVQWNTSTTVQGSDEIIAKMKESRESFGVCLKG